MTESREQFNLFQELTRLPKAHIIVPFPLNKNDKELPALKNRDLDIAIVTLSQSDRRDAKTKAHNQFVKEYGNIPHNEDYSDMLSYELLFRACKQPQDLGMRFFPTVNSMGEFSTEQLAILVSHYNHLEKTRGPILVDLTKPEMDNLIENIVSSGLDGDFFLNSLSPEELKTFTTFIVNQYWNLQMDKELLGKQQENTNSTESPENQ